LSTGWFVVGWQPLSGWVKEAGRTAALAPVRRALLDRFEREVNPYGEPSPELRAGRVEYAHSASSAMAGCGSACAGHEGPSVPRPAQGLRRHRRLARRLSGRIMQCQLMSTSPPSARGAVGKTPGSRSCAARSPGCRPSNGGTPSCAWELLMVALRATRSMPAELNTACRRSSFWVVRALTSGPRSQVV
jgi:hypothetical protein